MKISVKRSVIEIEERDASTLFLNGDAPLESLLS